MRWRPKPKYSVRKRFLLFPRKFPTYDTYREEFPLVEWRWLEIAYIKYHFEIGVPLSFAWATEEDYKRERDTKE